MVQARPVWTLVDQWPAGWRAGARQRWGLRRMEMGLEARIQGWEPQGRWLKCQHNQWVGFFFSLFNYQQQLWTDMNNPNRNLANWLGLNGGRSSRKEGRRTHSSSLLHQPLRFGLTARYCSLPGTATKRKACFSEWEKHLGWNAVRKKMMIYCFSSSLCFSHNPSFPSPPLRLSTDTFPVAVLQWSISELDHKLRGVLSNTQS